MSLAVSTAVQPVRVTRSTALNYRRADFDGLRQALSAVPWNLLDGLSVDDVVSMFYTFVESAVRDHIPLVMCKKRFPPWFDAVGQARAKGEASRVRASQTSPNRRGH